VAERYCYMESCVTIGRGYNYATAFELALKVQELTYTVVSPYSSADFLHGPLALVERGFPAIVVISDATEALQKARVALPLPDGVPEWLSPLTGIVPGQLLAMYLARARGYDPDHPRSLRKVTETR